MARLVKIERESSRIIPHRVPLIWELDLLVLSSPVASSGNATSVRFGPATSLEQVASEYLAPGLQVAIRGFFRDPAQEESMSVGSEKTVDIEARMSDMVQTLRACSYSGDAQSFAASVEEQKRYVAKLWKRSTHFDEELSLQSNYEARDLLADTVRASIPNREGTSHWAYQPGDYFE